MPENQKRSVLVRKPRSARDFVITGVLVVLGAALGNTIAALLRDDSATYLADTLPLTLAAAVPVTALVLAVAWRVRRRKGPDQPQSH